MPRFSRLVNKKPKPSLLRQLRLPPLRLQRLRQVPLQPKLQLSPLNRRLAQRKHLLSHPRHKLPVRAFGSLPPISVEDLLCTEVACEDSPAVAKLLLSVGRCGLGKPRFEMSPAGSLCFPKIRRLRHRPEYDRVKRNGITQRGKLLILNVMPMGDSGPWRAGFVTSSRLGGAVVRNRVRRRLREVVRRHQHELRQGVWFVIVARYEAATASYSALEDEWLRLARRASILL